MERTRLTATLLIMIGLIAIAFAAIYMVYIRGEATAREVRMMQTAPVTPELVASPSTSPTATASATPSPAAIRTLAPVIVRPATPSAR